MRRRVRAGDGYAGGVYGAGGSAGYVTADPIDDARPRKFSLGRRVSLLGHGFLRGRLRLLALYFSSGVFRKLEFFAAGEGMIKDKVWPGGIRNPPRRREQKHESGPKALESSDENRAE